MNRSNARELLMQLFFQMDIQNDFSPEAKNAFLELQMDDDEQIKYINSVYDAFINHKDEIDSLIESNSQGWKIGRLSKVDLAVMRLCLAEFKFMDTEDQTPIGAAINEAVRIAKKYDSDDSGKFVNGILGQISRQ